MGQGSGNGNSGQQGGPFGGGQGGSNKSNKTLLYVVIGIVIVILLVVVVLDLSSSSSVSITQNRSDNSTAIYMSSASAGALLGSSLSEYNATDMFSPYAAVNVSDYASIVPQITDNVSSAWVTAAAGSNATYNASLEYVVLTANGNGASAATLANLLGTNASTSLGMAATSVNSGTSGALNYTYGVYTNSTASVYVLYGYKGDNVVLLFVGANPGFSLNESQAVSTVASITPLH